MQAAEIASTRTLSSPIETRSYSSGRIPCLCPCCIRTHDIDDGQQISGYFDTTSNRFWVWCKKCVRLKGSKRLACRP